MKYYSQYRQDEFFDKIIFNQKKQGFFLDIGANDGITFSNSLYFEKELGWKGICFEPLKETFQKLASVRSAVLINGCAANFNGTETFFSISGYGEMLSGLKSKYDPRHLERLYKELSEHGGEVVEIDMQCFNINDILTKNTVKEIDFISLDTEGGELEIIKAIDFDKVYVRAITVENAYADPLFKKHLATKGFIKIKRLKTDEVYINMKEFGFIKRTGMKLKTIFF